MTDFYTTENKRDNVRALYERALLAEEKPLDTKEGPYDAFFRAGDYAFKRLYELKHELADFADETGMGAGATGFQGMADVKYLGADDALRLFNINEQLWHYERAKRHVIELMLEYTAKNDAESLVENNP